MATLSLTNRRTSNVQLVGRPKLSSLMQQAVGVWHPRYIIPGSSHLINLINPILHNARFGSSGGVDTNDPLVERRSGLDQFLYVGASQAGSRNRVRSALSKNWGSSSVHVRDIIAEVSFDSWATSELSFWGKRQSGTTSGSLLGLGVNTAGNIRCYWRDAGSVSRGAVVPHTFTGRGRRRVRALLDASGTDTNVQFFQWLNDAWVQLGSTQTLVGVTGIESINLQLHVGEAANDKITGSPFRAYKFELWEGSSTGGGTLIASPDFTDANVIKPPVTSFVDSVGNGWNFLYPTATAGRRMFIVEQPWISYDGIDDYHQVDHHSELDINPGEDFTVCVLIRGQWLNTVSVASRIINKRASFETPGWSLHMNESIDRLTFNIGDTGSAQSTSVDEVLTHGKSLIFFAERTADNRPRLYDESGKLLSTGNALTGDGDLRTTQPVRFGSRSSSVAELYNGLIGGIAIFKRSLTASEKKRIAEELRSL